MRLQSNSSCSGRIIVRAQERERRRLEPTPENLEAIRRAYIAELVRRGVPEERARAEASRIDIFAEVETARSLEDAIISTRELATRRAIEIIAEMQRERARVRPPEQVSEVLMPPAPEPAPFAPRIPFPCEIVQTFPHFDDALKEANSRKAREPGKLYGYAFDPSTGNWAVILCSRLPPTGEIINGLVVITMT